MSAKVSGRLKVRMLVLAAIVSACTSGGRDAAPHVSSAETREPELRLTPATSVTATPATMSDALQSTTSSATESPDATDATGVEDAAFEFYCGEFGAEVAPTLLAVDVVTGTPVWRMCLESGVYTTMWGRAVGATILQEQDGRGGSSLVGIDDTGVERWRRPTRIDQDNSLVSGSTVVTVAAEVEGIEAATGTTRWSHPVADGTPIGSTPNLVIEIAGGPYALSNETSPSTGGASMRAIDSMTGEQQWERVVELVPLPPRNQYTPTVGHVAIAIPATDGTTEIFDATTGELLRTETAFFTAEGVLIIERDPMRYSAVAIVDPVAGARLTAPEGLEVHEFVDDRVLPAGGFLVSSNPPTGPAARLRLIDLFTGTLRWEIPYLPVIGHSRDHIFVADGALLRVLDATDGSPVAEYRAPTELVTFQAAAAGDGIVIVSPVWRGSPNGSPPGTPSPAVPHGCEGGPVLLDTHDAETPVTVKESADGQLFCIEAFGASTIGSVPTVPTADPRFDELGFFGDSAWYTLALPEQFPKPATVIDQNGTEMIVARGKTNDYLVLIQARVGKLDGGPAPMRRTVDVVGPDGAVLAVVTFTGFGSEDGATFDEFAGCVREHGVAMVMPPPGGGPPPVVEPSPPAALGDAWRSCRDIFARYQRGSQQGGPEFLENQLAQLDCLAQAGYYQVFNEPVGDEAAFQIVWAACEDVSPGRLALVDCLRANGLDVVINGVISGGPHPTTQSRPAWEACRDVFLTWSFSGPMFTDSIVPRLDCAAELGWITVVMDPVEHAGAQVNIDLQQCPSPR